MHNRQFVPLPNKNKKIILIAGIILVIFIFSIPVTRVAVRNATAYVGTGIVRGVHGIGGWFGGFGTVFHTKASLEAENTALKSQIEELNLRMTNYNELTKENADLKSVMSRAGTTAHFILASVLEKPPVSLYDTLLIDGGSDVGMVAGQTVYADGVTPIGTIGHVFPTSATVVLFSAPSVTTPARLEPSHTDVVLTGRGGGNFSATIPHDLSVTMGDKVFTKELNSSVIAILGKVTSDARDPFQTLVLSAPVNVMQLSYVEVRQ